MQWQRDVSVSHGKIGHVLESLGDHDAALAVHRAALATANTISSRDPANTDWQRDVSVSHSKIGDVLRLQGDHEAALVAYRAALAIAETLATRDPAHTEWQRDLLVLRIKMAEIEPAEALAHRSRALEIARSLGSEGKLAATDQSVIDDLTQQIAQTSKRCDR